MRPIRAGVAAVLAVVLLGACSGEEPDAPPSPSETAPSTSATSESPTPTPTPPPLPPEATTMDAAGAAAFVRHWFDLVNYAYTTGETDPVSAISEATCEACTDILALIEAQYEDGGRFMGGTIEVEGAEAPEPDSSGVMLVTTRYRQDPVISVEANGSTTTTEARPTRTVGFIVALEGSRWVAAGIGT